MNDDENLINNIDINVLLSNNENNEFNKNIRKLIESIYIKIKTFKINLSNTTFNPFVYNFFTFKKNISNFYTIFPNINFSLKRIKPLSLSSGFPLNKLLTDKKHTVIKMDGKILNNNGFLSMTYEKRIITLIDDTCSNVSNSRSLKSIIFGIWINIKKEESSNYDNIEDLIKKYKYLIYKKCFEFVVMSSKIETIFSPNPDEGIFLMILFFKHTQFYYEVKIIPNENEKFVDDDVNNFENFWMIKKKKSMLKMKDLFLMKMIIISIWIMLVITLII